MKRQRGFVGVLFSVALASVASACGGGSGGSCGKVQPCGGDVVGNYNISGACFNSAAINMDIMVDCPGASVNYSNVHVTGTGSFNADLTYSISETVSATLSENIPVSCLSEGGLTITCAQLDQLLQQSLAMDPTSGVQSAHCSGSSSCSCMFVLNSMNISETGTYTTSGTTFTTTSSTGAVSASQYCVKGSELHVIDVDMTMPMAAIQADIVFTKR